LDPISSYRPSCEAHQQLPVPDNAVSHCLQPLHIIIIIIVQLEPVQWQSVHSSTCCQ